MLRSQRTMRGTAVGRLDIRGSELLLAFDVIAFVAFHYAYAPEGHWYTTCVGPKRFSWERTVRVLRRHLGFDVSDPLTVGASVYASYEECLRDLHQLLASDRAAVAAGTFDFIPVVARIRLLAPDLRNVSVIFTFRLLRAIASGTLTEEDFRTRERRRRRVTTKQ